MNELVHNILEIEVYLFQVKMHQVLAAQVVLLCAEHCKLDLKLFFCKVWVLKIVFRKEGRNSLMKPRRKSCNCWVIWFVFRKPPSKEMSCVNLKSCSFFQLKI